MRRRKGGEEHRITENKTKKKANLSAFPRDQHLQMMGCPVGAPVWHGGVRTDEADSIRTPATKLAVRVSSGDSPYGEGLIASTITPQVHLSYPTTLLPLVVFFQVLCTCANLLPTFLSNLISTLNTPSFIFLSSSHQMRFLAIVSVFFAVTQVAFAAPVFRRSHLMPRAGSIIPLEVFVHGHRTLNEELARTHPEAAVPQSQTRPQVDHSSITPAGFKTNDGSFHEIRPLQQDESQGPSGVAGVLHTVKGSDGTVQSDTQVFRHLGNGNYQHKISHVSTTRPGAPDVVNQGAVTIPFSHPVHPGRR
ncbi:hypothetical protein K439DRAFT_1148134 [Ramaria rubella]|nr:hypothetical protein K439DRAFT_1148134 [Ramaria rubella]